MAASGKRVAIFGDNCIDLYYVGTAKGLSAEAPVPVIKQTSSLALPGMAGNVAKLLGDLGGIEPQLIFGANAHLPIKNRLMTEAGQQLARWDYEDYCRPLLASDFDRFERGPRPDAIIVSDYGKGTLDSFALGRLRYYSEQGIPTFVDTKSDPFVWLGCPVVLFPNQYEFAQWQTHYEWMPAVVLKQGAQGISFMRYGDHIYHLPAQARQVQNVCGAGDAVIASFVWAALQGFDIYSALCCANTCAAALVEQRFDSRRLCSPLSAQKERTQNDGTSDIGSAGGTLAGDNWLSGVGGTPTSAAGGGDPDPGNLRAGDPSGDNPDASIGTGRGASVGQGQPGIWPSWTSS